MFKGSKKYVVWIGSVLFLCTLCFVSYQYVKNNKDDLVIVRVDGGICSQIGFCGLGHELSQKGYKVKYDLSWFQKDGKDNNGIFARNYDMQRAFPNLKFEEATEEEIKLYAKKYRILADDVGKFSPPMYVDGYPERYSYFIKYRDFFIKNFVPGDIYKIKDILHEIESCNACAVHVRRGDLSGFDKVSYPGYGAPCSVDYFLRAIKIMISICDKQPKFFFFSDEPNWVKDNIIPKLDKDVEYYVCEKNGSDAGYLDLYLISKCKQFICSIGSLGFFGRALSRNNGYLITPISRVEFANAFDNCVILFNKIETKTSLKE